jgi:GH15 family glucan-1,4-alpha-glucosidase
MVASATMSLPERADQSRNYDYRYAWIRDQCYAGIAVARHGHFHLLDSAVSFVTERLLADGPSLKPAYTVRGGRVPSERKLSHLQGYPGGTDKVGNWVNKQFQLDTFGEALELYAAAASCDRLDAGHWNAIEVAASAIESRWREADAGIWEIDPQRWAHSRLTCVSGLRGIAAEAPNPQSGRWSALADAILADVSSDCLHPAGRWQRAPDDPRIDASLLLPIIRGALPVTDPRSTATIGAVEAELYEEGFVYRFRPDGRPLGEAEGAFLLCGFLLALAKHQQGDHLGARGLYERNRSACGTPGLMAEEFDVRQRQLRGNLPQAFVHAVLLECAAVLGAVEGYPRLA